LRNQGGRPLPGDEAAHTPAARDFFDVTQEAGLIGQRPLRRRRALHRQSSGQARHPSRPVVDLSELGSNAARRRFMAAFSETLYEANEEPLYLVLSTRRYRHWCLQNRLFLNPLNDLGAHSIAGGDVLTLPDFVTAIDEPPTLIGFFNQMKQEFASARWLYYEGVHAHDPHLSDRDVLLFNTLDYPSYGLAVDLVEKDFEDVMEPDAEALYKIRNHLEHKYLKVQEILIPRTPDTKSSSLWVDRLAYSVQREVFEAKTLRLLRLARAALIYSSLGMHCEEIRRRKNKGKTMTAPMILDIWDDEWKR
jgi:hypothetical protein